MGQFQSAPAPALYGVFNQRLAQTMGENPLSHAALIMNADRESQDYTHALRQAQQTEMAMAQDTNQADVAKTYLTALPQMAAAGLSRGVSTAGMGSYANVDPNVLTQSDLVGTDLKNAEGVEKRSAAVKNYSEAGHVVDQKSVEHYLRGPLAGDNYLNFVKDGPSQQEIGMANADAAMENAHAHTISANKGQGDGTTTTIVSLADGQGGYTPLSSTTKTKGGAHVTADAGAGAGAGQPPPSDGKVTVYARGSGAPRRVNATDADKYIAQGVATLSPPGK